MAGRHRSRRPRAIVAPVSAAVLAIALVAVGIALRSSSPRSTGSPAAQGAAASAPFTPSTESSVSAPAHTDQVRSAQPAGSITPSSPAPTTPAPPIGAASLAGSAPGTASTTTRPTHLTVASIGVSTALQPLGLLGDGSLQPPTRWNEAGWYARGIVPGEVGPAVIAGHVDSTTAAAVFYRLRDLKVGAHIVVTRQDGKKLTFVVDHRQTFVKARFPTQVVYGPTPDPELRLVTCTGDFDAAAHNYLDNLVVSAHLI